MSGKKTGTNLASGRLVRFERNVRVFYRELSNDRTQIPAAGRLRTLRPALTALTFFLPALLAAQEVFINLYGVASVPVNAPIYNGQYVVNMSDMGFFWLDTAALE